MKLSYQISSSVLILLLATGVFSVSVHTAYATTETFNSSTSWTVPADVCEVTVHVWGAGGGGNTGSGNDAGGGGGAGAFASSTLAVTPDASITIEVGLGGGAGTAGDDSWFDSSGTVMAKGGSAASLEIGGTGGAAASSVGTVTFSGGNGANGETSGNPGNRLGGGGGGSATASADGGDAVGSSGGAGEGAGGNGTSGATTGGAGTAPGGAGGGGGSTGTGGNGADGRVVLFYTAEPGCDDASPPSVTTNTATNVVQTSATLNGEITATGGEDATQHGFAFGTNSNLSGGDTATSTLGGFTGTGSFNENETSLTADTTYYFRAYATNSGGTGYGTIQNFTTDAIPPDLSQSAYRWFTNTDTTSVGSASGINTPSFAPSQGTPFRLRMLLHVSSGQLDASATTTKLQFAEKGGGACSAASYSDVTTDTTAIRYHNNTPSDDTALTTHHQDPSHNFDNVVAQTYNDGDGVSGADTFSNSQAAIPAGDDGLWDFALVDNSASANTTYCFRAVQEGGGVLTAGYEQFPEITTEDVTRVRLLGRIVLRTVRLF